MHERAADFRERALNRYDIDPDVVEFPDGTKTAADAADAIGCSVAQIASSLVFEVDESLVVCVTSGANRVDEGALGDHFDVRESAVEMADPDHVRETIGWAIGGVPPLCHETTVPVVLDRTLLEFDEVWAAAGTPSAVFPIDPARLRSLSDATPIEVAAPS
ncbi:YbaK/EbsC family protein [Halovivax cerinus]|uniref:YbaK/EbsC family protein n=1 Tax=Halovivax cerinus TaxID=1487865 RepID=A0ABD5NML6_9EURY|nr:YbaK/EbsC family protein [Halovivax cerinus]